MTHDDDIYTRITNKIIADLEKELPAARKPWSHLKLDSYVFDPKTPWEDTPFEAPNTVMLWKTALEKGYTSPFWMTEKQALALEARVRSGEVPTDTIFSDTVTVMEPKADQTLQRRTRYFLRPFPVFNAEQIEGLPRVFLINANPSKQLAPSERIEEAERFFKRTHAEIVLSGRAGYAISDDTIEMPPFECFDDAPSYYATLAHELIHWTQHPNRLNRISPDKTLRGADYAREEMIAELGASFLMAYLGIEPIVSEKHGAYIKPWLRDVHHAKDAVREAAREAQRAVEYVKSLQPPTNDASMQVKPVSPTPRG